MNICAVIVEYNPFHNGHLYHIQKAKELTNADYIIAIMSGNYMQRGTPSVLCKFERTRMALMCGVDLVIELPAYYATGSAEFFAKGAVSIIQKLGCVTHLCFGSELGEIQPLKQFASILQEEPPTFKKSLRENLKQGMTYPQARSRALLDTEPSLTEYADALSNPNNILGVEYLKALLSFQSSITPITISRIGNGYHEQDLDNPFASASALRQAMQASSSSQGLSSYMPQNTLDILEKWQESYSLVWTDDFSSILRYQLLSKMENGFSSYIDVSDDLSDRILNHIDSFERFSSFCDILKTKEITHTRINRALCHILLDMKKDDLEHYMQDLSWTPYIRILGFRKDAEALLSAIHASCTVPMVTKAADARKILSPDAYTMFEKELAISRIYYGVLSDKTGKPPRNELSTPITIV